MMIWLRVRLFLSIISAQKGYNLCWLQYNKQKQILKICLKFPPTANYYFRRKPPGWTFLCRLKQKIYVNSPSPILRGSLFIRHVINSSTTLWRSRFHLNICWQRNSVSDNLRSSAKMVPKGPSMSCRMACLTVNSVSSAWERFFWDTALIREKIIMYQSMTAINRLHKSRSPLRSWTTWIPISFT